MEKHIKIKDIIIDLSHCFEKKDEAAAECEHFTIRGFASEMRKKDPSRCNPFPANESGEHPPLPPMEVRRFRRFGCENCRDRAAANGVGMTFVKEPENLQQEHVVGGLENEKSSPPPTNNADKRELDLNKVVDLNGNEGMPRSDERENNNEVANAIADHEVNNLEDRPTSIIQEANNQGKKVQRKFRRTIHKKTIKEPENLQQEHVVSGVENEKSSPPPTNNADKRELNLNKAVDLNGNEGKPRSDERENNNEVANAIAIADHEVNNLEDRPTSIIQEANNQGKTVRRKFRRTIHKKPIKIPTNDDSSDSDDKPKKTRLLSDVMRSRETVIPVKKKAGRGRKRKSLAEINCIFDEALHEVNNEIQMDRVVEGTFSPSSNHEGTSRSQHNIRGEKEPDLIQDLNMPPIDINENIEPENMNMNVDTTMEENVNDNALSIDKEAMEVADILVNNLPTRSPQENSSQEQRKIRDFDLNCPIVIDLDEDHDSNNVDEDLTNGGRGLEMISIGETSEPLRIVPENYYCRHNKNPADFTAPEEGNPFMMKGDDIIIFERNFMVQLEEGKRSTSGDQQRRNDFSLSKN